jgi:hypothetical protein
VDDAIKELVSLYREGKLKDDASCYNIKAMKKLDKEGIKSQKRILKCMKFKSKSMRRKK